MGTGAAGYAARARWRAGWRAQLVTALLVGALGGLALASLAGARRTASAEDRFLRSTNPSQLSVDTGKYDPAVVAAEAALPGVVSAKTYVAMYGTALKSDGEPNFDVDVEAIGSVDGRFIDDDRMAIRRGRLPNPGEPSEVAMDEIAADAFHLHVGDRVPLVFISPSDLESDEPPAGGPAAQVTATVVGVGLFNDEIAQDEVDRIGRILLTPAFTNAHLDIADYSWTGLRIAPGTSVASVAKAYDRLVHDRKLQSSIRYASGDAERVQRVQRPLALALGGFGGICALVALLLGAQALGRLVRAEQPTSEVLRALGAARPTRTAAALSAGVVPILLGSVLAVAVAVALSPFAPIGPVGRFEPNPGVQVDLTVMLFGFLVIVAVLGGSIAMSARGVTNRVDGRARIRTQRASAPDIAARAGMSGTAVTGLRMAFQPNARDRGAPIRTAVAGTIIAVLALTTAVTFRSSLDHLVSQPALYGWSWNVTVVDDGGYGSFDMAKVHETLDRDDDVRAWSGFWLGPIDVDGEPTGALGVEPGQAIQPPIIEGRAVAATDEVVLGSGLLARLDKSVGDDVTIAVGGRDRRFRVVGRAALPTLGQIHGARVSLGDGVVIDRTRMPYAGLVGGNNDGPAFVAVDLADGAPPGAAHRIGKTVSAAGGAPGSALDFGVLRPAEIAHEETLGRAPTLLAGLLAAAAVVSLALALAAVVRRRRHDLGVLKVLGFTPRQLASTVAWQATVTIVLGIVVGLPLGIAGGRMLWSLFAGELDVVPEASVPVVLLAAAAAAIVLIANALALVPARAAARTPSAVVLRAE